MQSSRQAPGLVSIADLKKLARTRVLSSSALRDLILSEPDYLPDEEFRVKVMMYWRILYRKPDRASP